MISEATFSKKFTSFWNELLPNSKNHTRLINGGLVQYPYEPLETAERKNNTALVNVLSFILFRSVCKKEKSLDFVVSNKCYESNYFYFSVNSALHYLARFSYREECSLPLTSKEKEQVREIFKILYARYLSDSVGCEVDPRFDGCGFINESYGDLFSGRKLVEIKSGERRFSVADLRQVLVYLTLNYFSRNSFSIEMVEIFNPRMGILYNETVEEFCLNLSSLSSQELFFEVQRFVSERNFVEEYGV